MKIYCDILSNDELLADSLPIIPILDSCGYEVASEKISVGDDFDIGTANASDNPDAEKVINLVNMFAYTEVSFNKADYTTYLKAYVQKIKAYLEENKPDRVEAFLKESEEMEEWILKNFDNFQFWVGESKNTTDAMIILSYYKSSEDAAPHFVYFADGLNVIVV